ncbi:hypothetical protein AB0L97_33075 [Nocardia sp. NPDC051911]|uniref:hypothetical protein n=1 Tax=Nocardia sp. NPDC051911 TaxID=3154648 RepID=UPI0034388BED
MNDDWTVFVIVAALIIANVLLVVSAVLWLWPERIPRGRSVGEIRDRVLGERAAQAGPEHDVEIPSNRGDPPL